MYKWVTQEMYDNKLRELLRKTTAEQLLLIPGIYDVISEEYNNEVLAALKQEREEEA